MHQCLTGERQDQVFYALNYYILDNKSTKHRLPYGNTIRIR